MESDDEVLRRALRRLLEEAARSEEVGRLGPGTPPGVYEYEPGRRAWRRARGPWRPSGDGLYVVLHEASGRCRACEDFGELASAAPAGLAFVADLLDPGDPRPTRLTLSCVAGGEVVLERTYRGALGLPELSSLVLRFARACPSVDAEAASARIRAVCPCADY